MKDLSGTPDNFAKNIKDILAFHDKYAHKPKTAEEEYPEIERIAKIEVDNILRNINKFPNEITNCPYPKQCLLEMVIAKLEKCV
jgi:hypothetical protein